MKKKIFILVFILLIISAGIGIFFSLNNNEGASNVNGNYNANGTPNAGGDNHQTSTENGIPEGTNANTFPSIDFPPPADGVTFREIDLSEPFWAGYSWYEYSVDARGDIDLSQFAGQSIESREMAKNIANEILAQHQAQGFSRNFVLVNIAHDPTQNIWIFGYSIYPLVPGDGLAAAVDGNTGELLRLWVN